MQPLAFLDDLTNGSESHGDHLCRIGLPLGLSFRLQNISGKVSSPHRPLS